MKPGSRFVCCIALLVMLPACSTTPPLTQPEPVTTVRVVTTTSYQELPDIPMPTEPTLVAWQYDVPRDLSKLEPKNTTKCLSVPEANRNDAYWASCGIHPPIKDSNVLYGFDERNWNILLSNFGALREYIIQLKARIDVANEQRSEWREKAEQERRKAAAAGAAPAASPSSPSPPEAPAAKQ